MLPVPTQREHHLAHLPTDAHERRLYLIAEIAHVTHVAQAEIGRVFAWEAAFVMDTLVYTYTRLLEAHAGGMPEEEIRQLWHDFAVYCCQMRGISVTAAIGVTQVIDSLPRAYLPSHVSGLLPDEH